MDIINIIDTMISEKSDIYSEETSLSENELFINISKHDICGYYYSCGHIVYTLEHNDKLFEIFIFNHTLFVRMCNNNMICFIEINNLTRCILISSVNNTAYDWMTKWELDYKEIAEVFKNTEHGIPGFEIF